MSFWGPSDLLFMLCVDDIFVLRASFKLNRLPSDLGLLRRGLVIGPRYITPKKLRSDD